MKRLLKAILVGAQKEEESCGESLSPHRERLSSPRQNAGRKKGGKGHSHGVSEGNEDHVIETGEKTMLIIKWRRTGWVMFVFQCFVEGRICKQ